MIHLSADEKILMVLHRHWIVIFGKFSLGVFLLLVPFFILPIVSSFGGAFAAMFLFAEFLSVIYLMIVVLLVLIFWMDYYLDVWIITSERIIDIEQNGLFNRKISEFTLDKVQDITVKVPNMLATFLKYGDVIIQTAGETSFEIKQIPNFYEAKNLILDYSKQKNVGAQQVGANQI